MAPARSIQCMRRPPNRAARGLASFGRTISAISDCESRTGRGAGVLSVMAVFPSGQAAVSSALLWMNLRFLFQVRLQKAFCHCLDTWVCVLPRPGRSRQFKFKIAMFDGAVISFANVVQKKGSGRRGGIPGFVPPSRIGRRRDGKTHGVPNLPGWPPTATTGISQIAECLQNILTRSFAFVARSRAVTAPSRSQRKPSGMRPTAIFEFPDRHEIGTGHSLFSEVDLLGTGHCNEFRVARLVFTPAMVFTPANGGQPTGGPHITGAHCTIAGCSSLT